MKMLIFDAGPLISLAINGLLHTLELLKEKYPDVVFVYFVGDYSKEICMGPHVENTKELGSFKIIKEQSIAAGVRRIKAILE